MPHPQFTAPLRSQPASHPDLHIHAPACFPLCSIAFRRYRTKLDRSRSLLDLEQRVSAPEPATT